MFPPGHGLHFNLENDEYIQDDGIRLLCATVMRDAEAARKRSNRGLVLRVCLLAEQTLDTTNHFGERLTPYDSDTARRIQCHVQLQHFWVRHSVILH